ncbi:hypothetical protein PO124_15400 [Bacillus licheniformis]|nr:hypothetical protein [Bacillus licheniformis]
MVELPIVMNHVEVRAGDRKLLENVSLAVDKGSRVCSKEKRIGKSTFLKAITGLSLFAGEILIYGQSIIQTGKLLSGISAMSVTKCRFMSTLLERTI